MVEYKDASPEERAVNLCNWGMMAARTGELFDLLARVGNDNAAGEYYLPDIVMLAATDGRRSAVIEAEPWELAGVNSRAELALVEAEWRRRRRPEAMADGGGRQRVGSGKCVSVRVDLGGRRFITTKESPATSHWNSD